MDRSEIEQDGRSHLRAEIARVASLLAKYLDRLRSRGKSVAGEAVRGFVIEDGEAEGIIADLIDRWNRPSAESLPIEKIPEKKEKSGLFTSLDADDKNLLPLKHVVRKFELTAVEYVAVLLALSVEVDGCFGRLIAYLNDHVGHTRPTIGLALELGAIVAEGAAPSPLAFCQRPVIQDGLLELESEGPVPGLSLRLANDMALRLASETLPGMLTKGLLYLAPESDLPAKLVLEETARNQLAAWSRSLTNQGRAVPLVLSGTPGSGRTTVAHSAMSELGSPLVSLEIPAHNPAERLKIARRESRWFGSPLLIRIIPPALGERVDWLAFWAGLADLPAPLVIAVGPDLADGLTASAPVHPLVVQLPEPDVKARAALWRAMLPAAAQLPAEDVDQLAARFRFNPGRIQLAIRGAASRASFPSSNKRNLELAALLQSCRDVGSVAMGPLAQKLPLPFIWNDLIVPAPIRSELELARTWVRQQRKVLDTWGFARRVSMGRGLSMLLSGLPGTGKTMAAQVLARDLGLDLYRVDLSRTVSKYIGETEKNLSCLFDEAQASGAALFFDEADALFGKRSEVTSAHDRHANLEIGYLLQRMEEYDGVTILATNRARDLDDAFTRRFHFIIDIPMPDEAHRLKIWEGMFPVDAEREADLDFRHLAKAFEISGGEIKNTALAGAYIAAGESRPIRMADLQRAVRREFVKSGRVLNARSVGRS